MISRIHNMVFDFKKEYKEFYMPKGTPQIVDVPNAAYIAVRGKGNPNEASGAYQRAISVLYAVACTLKMSYKGNHKIEGFFEVLVFDLVTFAVALLSLLFFVRIPDVPKENVENESVMKAAKAGLVYLK